MTPYLGCEQGPNLPVGTHPFALMWEQAEFVRQCRHETWEHVLARPDASGQGNEVVVRCRACFAPRCGHSTDFDPCMRVRHHGDKIKISSRYVEERVMAVGTHFPYSEWLIDRTPPSNATREELEAWLSE